MSNFLSTPGDYNRLIAFKKAMCVYDGTMFFTRRFMNASDRTVGQMQQAARSCKQNIVEGNVDGATSTYSNIHLLNIALGSLEELRQDFLDYLRVNNLSIWKVNSAKCQHARKACARHNEPEYYINAFETRTPETIANIMLVIIMQSITLTGRLLASRKEQFVKKGGKKEEMYRERKKYRDGDNSSNSNNETGINNSVAGEPVVEYGTSDELPY